LSRPFGHRTQSWDEARISEQAAALRVGLLAQFGQDNGRL
jgi:hypothetical protein